MAKAVYIGNDNAKKVKKMYLGNGTSHKVKKGYIGNESGKARLFYSSGRIWKKYNTVTTRTYQWSKYGVYSERYIHEEEWHGSILAWPILPTYTFYTTTVEPTLDISGNYVFGSYEKITYHRGSTLEINGGVYLLCTNNHGETPMPGVIYYFYSDSGITVTTTSKGQLQCSGHGYMYGRRDRYVKDDFLDYVYSSNRSEYPDDDYENNYWYVYEKEEISYSRGTYISDVESDNPNAYPSDGRHTDGYWYVRQ